MKQDAIRAVLRHHPAVGSRRMVAVVLASFADDDGASIALTVSEIARLCRLHERGVQRHLRTLLASGWLEHLGSGTGGRGRARRYRINPDWLAILVASDVRGPQPKTCDVLDPQQQHLPEQRTVMDDQSDLVGVHR